MQLILIGGAQRSGTTLLQTLLANALGSPNLPEAHILHDILAAYKRSKEFGNKTRIFYPTDDSLLAFFRSFAERHVADIADGAKTGVLVLKDPNFVQTLDEAAAIFPQSIRIVCMRDPRDIAASFVQIGERQQARATPGKYAKRDIYFISKKIMASYDPLLDQSRQSNAVLVRYENLARDPEATFRALGRDAGLDLSFERIEQADWLDPEARHEASWVTELEGAKPSPASVGSFARVLRGDEIAMVQKHCKPIMRKFDYPLIENPNPGRRARVLGFFGFKPRLGKR
jgi:Sulfotransferase family